MVKKVTQKFLKIPLKIKTTQNIGGFFTAAWFPLNIIILVAFAGIGYLIYYLIQQFMSSKKQTQCNTKTQTSCGQICCDNHGLGCCGGQCKMQNNQCCTNDGNVCPHDQCSVNAQKQVVCCDGASGSVPDPNSKTGCVSCPSSAYCSSPPTTKNPTLGKCVIHTGSKSPPPWSPQYPLKTRGCSTDNDCNYTVCPTENTNSCCITSACMNGECCHAGACTGQNDGSTPPVQTCCGYNQNDGGGCCISKDYKKVQCCNPEQCCDPESEGKSLCIDYCAAKSTLLPNPNNGTVSICPTHVPTCPPNNTCSWPVGSNAIPNCEKDPTCTPHADPIYLPYNQTGGDAAQDKGIQNSGVIPLYNCKQQPLTGADVQKPSAELGTVGCIIQGSRDGHPDDQIQQKGQNLYAAGTSIGKGKDKQWITNFGGTTTDGLPAETMGAFVQASLERADKDILNCNKMEDGKYSCVCDDQDCLNIIEIGTTGDKYNIMRDSDRQPINCTRNDGGDIPTGYTCGENWPTFSPKRIKACVQDNTTWHDAGTHGPKPCKITSTCSGYLEPIDAPINGVYPFKKSSLDFATEPTLDTPNIAPFFLGGGGTATTDGGNDDFFYNWQACSDSNSGSNDAGWPGGFVSTAKDKWNGLICSTGGAPGASEKSPQFCGRDQMDSGKSFDPNHPPVCYSGFACAYGVQSYDANIWPSNAKTMGYVAIVPSDSTAADPLGAITNARTAAKKNCQKHTRKPCIPGISWSDDGLAPCSNCNNDKPGHPLTCAPGTGVSVAPTRQSCIVCQDYCRDGRWDPRVSASNPGGLPRNCNCFNPPGIQRSPFSEENEENEENEEPEAEGSGRNSEGLGSDELGETPVKFGPKCADNPCAANCAEYNQTSCVFCKSGANSTLTPEKDCQCAKNPYGGMAICPPGIYPGITPHYKQKMGGQEATDKNAVCPSGCRDDKEARFYGSGEIGVCGAR